MAEYLLVEQPFLAQLKKLDWQAIDQGSAIPTNPSTSLRSSFRDVLLKETFLKSIHSINLTEEGKQPWLTAIQLEQAYNELLDHPRKNLLQANIDVFGLLTNNMRADRNELTGEESPVLRLIDFDNPERNSFIVINQFRIDTPGVGKGFIIPDIVLFVNGIPLVVVECKEQTEYCSNPRYEAIEQLLRYSNQREATRLSGLKEGEETLFWFNQFCIATYGEKAFYGTITSSEEYYFEWKDIYPDQYKIYTPPLTKERSQEKLIQGMLPPATLLDMMRSFTLFEKEKNGVIIKKIARYQQYRAVGKIIHRLRTGNSPIERSGVVWHTQGSGKSLTMVMLVRKLRTIPELMSYKILMVNDRTDLEDQLGDTAVLTGEKVYYVENKKELREKLSAPTSNLVMVMIHKFSDHEDRDTTMVGETLKMVAEYIPRYGVFGGVNESEKILILIDEAHRTQSSDIGDNLFEAFPNSTKIAFTGTPLITDRHKKKTHEKFGTYIDKYKLQDAVEDGATLQILYEGKTSDNAINEKHLFETKFEDLVKERSEKEKELIKKKYGTYGDVLESEKRIAAIATDLANHYVDHVLPSGFKAQVVASSVLAAVRYKHAIANAINERLKQIQNIYPINEATAKQLAFLKVEAVVSGQGTNEAAIITEARKSALTNKAVDNFKEKFNYEKPLSGIAFLVVCDMLLTGFDAPIEQILYIDKKMKEHSLLQAIARVNRTNKGKTRGYVVDYIGNTKHLKEALQIYSADDREDILNSFKDINTEIPVLQHRYQRLLLHFEDVGIKHIKAWVEQTITNAKEEIDILELCVVKGEDVQFRADFDVYFNAFAESMDIVLPNAAANQFKIPAKRFGWILFKVRQRYKDDSINLEGIGAKIKQLINEHLVSLGINPKIPPVELFSRHFEEEVNKNVTKQAIASEMEHAIRKHIKINMQDDPVFYQKLWEKLEAAIKQHQEDYDRMVDELFKVRSEAMEGRHQTEEGVSQKEAPFYDLMMKIAFNGNTSDKSIADTCKQVNASIIERLEHTIGIIGFWQKGDEIKKIKGNITDDLLFPGVTELMDNSDNIAVEILTLAKRRHDELIGPK